MLIPFSQIIAQDQAKEMLRRALTGDRLAHAYLFRGPEGIGKKTAARALAATLNCVTVQQQRIFGQADRLAYPGYAAPDRLPESAPPLHGDAAVPTGRPDPLEACGLCPSCRKFASGNHPDFLEIMPEGAGIKIGQVREIKKSLQYPPMEAGRRVVLLGEVHTMRREAANSLLKVLEEPPADTILILTGDEAGGILPTILSRCQVIPFFPLPTETLALALLKSDPETGGRQAPQNRRQDPPLPEEFLTLAAVAEGSLGRARQLQQKGFLALRREVLDALLNLRPEEPAATAVVLYWAERCAQLKDELEDFIDLLASCYHDLSLLDGYRQSNQPDIKASKLINRDLLPLLSAAAGRRDTAALGRCRQHLRRAKSRLRRNCNRTLVCEVLFFDLL